MKILILGRVVTILAYFLGGRAIFHDDIGEGPKIALAVILVFAFFLDLANVFLREKLLRRALHRAETAESLLSDRR